MKIRFGNLEVQKKAGLNKPFSSKLYFPELIYRYFFLKSFFWYMKKYLVLFLIFRFCVCNGQVNNLPLCFEDLNIPLANASKSFFFAKKMLDKGIIKASNTDSSIWHKVVIRFTNEDEIHRIPFNFQKHEKLGYWDTTLVQEPENCFKIINCLHDLALNNSIKCYSFDGTKQYGKKELEALLIKRDSIYVIDEPNEPKKIAQYNEVLMYEASEVIIVEEWRQSISGIENRILAIAPIMPKYDEVYNYLGATLMCWFIL